MPNKDSVTRHCAYCLTLCGFPAKLCGGCKKRAYCSKECQAKDWSRKGDGQRHVNWCRRHECGEEDVDWEVVPIPNKGLGIRAKKLIPAGMKLIVEPCFSSSIAHQGIKDLEGGTLEKKFTNNILVGEYFRKNVSDPIVALRIARVNHACQPNAATIYDETARVAILFTQKDIQPGEEITICYYFPYFFWHIPDKLLNLKEEFEACKNVLATKFGITCSSDCICYDPAIWALIEEGRQLFNTVEALAHQHRTEEALVAGEKLLGIYHRFNVSWEYLGRVKFSLFQIAIQKSETLPRSKEYIRSVVELFRKICPYSKRHTKEFEKLLQNPDSSPSYLWIDRMKSF